jgi:peptidoglycan hydrolase-like protein with peptidoglycan-binding domain
MTGQLILLVAGFLLTGVVGGVLGHIFQRLTWTHQHEVQRRDEEYRLAVKTFEEVSSLLDRRLYRMRRVNWAARRGPDGHQLSVALDDYRDVLLVWNDNLNRIQALVDTSFGSGVRRQLEVDIFERYAAIGRALDDLVRQVSSSEPGVDAPIGRRLDQLSHQVYRLNSRMLQLLQQQQIGRSAPRASAGPASGSTMVQLGDQGPAVRRLQRALSRAGESHGRIDGDFGRTTDRALRSFQSAHGLDPDGTAGPRVWAVLPGGAAMPVLREGSSGEIVERLQTALIEFAPERWQSAPGQADGVFGATTTRSVEAFQRWHGLGVDGVVGDTTWSATLDDGTSLEAHVGLHHADKPQAPASAFRPVTRR